MPSDELSKQLVGLFLLFDEVGHHFEQQELVVSFGFVYFDGFKVLPCHFFSKHFKTYYIRSHIATYLDLETII